jgi:hypothetical protein
MQFFTCPPANIDLAVSGVTPRQTSFTLPGSATKQLAIVVTDTNGLPITDHGLSFFSTSPAVAGIGPTALVNAGAPGIAHVLAVCAPPRCNNGTGQTIYSNTVDVTVTGTLTPRVYVMGKNATSIVPIDPATNVAGTPITIPTVVPAGKTAAQQPVLINAMFSPDATRLFIGTDIALFIFDPSTNTLLSSNNAAVGKILTVATNNSVAVADPVNPQVRLFVPSSASVSDVLAVSQATAAAFAPDSSKIYIAGANGILAFSSSGSTTIPTAQVATDITVLNQGSIFYAASPSPAALRPFRTCDLVALPDIAGILGDPLFVRTTDDSSRLFAIDTQRIYEIGITLNTIGCPPSVTHTGPVVTNFGIGTFTPRQLLVSQSGTKAFVLSEKPNVLAYDATTDTPSTISLAGGATSALSGGILPDGSNLYIGAAGTNDVHRIDVNAGTDAQQIAVNLKDKNNAATSPDIVVVKPR